MPDWHPCYTVYVHQGQNQENKIGFIFQRQKDAIDWAHNQFIKACGICCDLKHGECLEVWEVEYTNLDPEYKGRIIGLRSFLSRSSFSRLSGLSSKIRAATSLKGILAVISQSLYDFDKIIGMSGAKVANNIILTKKIYQTQNAKTSSPIYFGD